MAAARSLVIVESPAKARTIAGFLGSEFLVESSIGHIRDLPERASDVPAAYKKEPWARLGVDVEHDFKPLYIVDPDKKAHIQKLKDLLAESKELFLATDEDREGEAIAWHLLEVLKPKVPVKRMVFHEITRAAIHEAIAHPRELDRRLVDAQEARRILDRLYGYEVSPVLWKKVMPKLSAGRVQSVATRIIVEREKARMRFRSASYWDIEATFEEKGQAFGATLVSVGGKRLVASKDFDELGKLTKEGVRLDEKAARDLATNLLGETLSVSSLEKKPTRRQPAPPFMTSTLQQEAARKLRFASARTMRSAQRLYEGGFITYMRTDSIVLSATAVVSARAQIERMYGAEYVPKEPRAYNKKVKNAQEAHEAIRPAGEVFRLPEEVAGDMGPDEAKLYELIWMRTVASQMPDSLGETVSVRIGGKSKTGDVVELAASGHTVTFPGFLRAYLEGSDDPAAELESRERHLPVLTERQPLRASTFEPKSHETQPAARYTEAALIQKLEELGVGRPSTYASIISTIVDRGYVWKKGTALVPSFKAFSVVALLEKHFDSLVDYAFTAKMEDELDAIATGQQEAVPWLSRFYFGAEKNPKGKNGESEGLGLRSLVADRLDEIDARAINTLPLGTDAEGREIAIRVGKYGPYLQRGEDTARVPDDLTPDELTLEKAQEMLDAPSADRLVGPDPETTLPVYVKAGRFGPYVQLGDGGKDEKPKTASLLKRMTPADVTLDEALQLLSLPRVVGPDPAGVDITAQLGRFGAYVTRGEDSRSLENEEQVFTVTVEEALALLALPKARPKRASAEPLKVLADDAISKKQIKVMQGRFGVYVTDGETNASLRREDALETLTQERAEELLQMRRDRDPDASKGRGSKKSSAKKTTSKKVVAKQSAGTKEAASEGVASKEPKKAAAAKTEGDAKSSAKPKAKAKAKKSKSAAPASGSKAAKPKAGKSEPKTLSAKSTAKS